jgi:hypothetical protein
MGMLDDMVKPWWLKPEVFVGVLGLLGLAVTSYVVVAWAIHEFLWDLLADFLSALI